MPRLQVKEVSCKTLLHKLEFGKGLEYTANLYRGCSHGCVYCYAPSLVHDERKWGAFVDAKVNAPSVLAAELRSLEKAPVFLSSASDPYQPVEARYRLTRRCLEVLKARRFPVVVLTRSPLVLRDIDLLTRMEWVRVGCSISTASERAYEPGVVPVERRLECLKQLSRAGVKTWVSLAPIVPGIITMDLRRLVSRIKEAGVSTVTPGLLRFGPYPDSRKMFEESTGLGAESVLGSGDEVLGEVREMISSEGFVSADELFSWEEAQPRLDAYAS